MRIAPAGHQLSQTNGPLLVASSTLAIQVSRSSARCKVWWFPWPPPLSVRELRTHSHHSATSALLERERVRSWDDADVLLGRLTALGDRWMLGTPAVTLRMLVGLAYPPSGVSGMDLQRASDGIAPLEGWGVKHPAGHKLWDAKRSMDCSGRPDGSLPWLARVAHTGRSKPPALVGR